MFREETACELVRYLMTLSSCESVYVLDTNWASFFFVMLILFPYFAVTSESMTRPMPESLSCILSIKIRHVLCEIRTDTLTRRSSDDLLGRPRPLLTESVDVVSIFGF